MIAALLAFLLVLAPLAAEAQALRPGSNPDRHPRPPSNNAVIVVQDGVGNAAGVVQRGSDHLAVIEQIGNDNTACIIQRGSGTAVGISQMGDNQAALVVRTPTRQRTLTGPGAEARARRACGF
jgi:Curlin associated repeat